MNEPFAKGAGILYAARWLYMPNVEDFVVFARTLSREDLYLVPRASYVLGSKVSSVVAESVGALAAQPGRGTDLPLYLSLSSPSSTTRMQ